MRGAELGRRTKLMKTAGIYDAANAGALDALQHPDAPVVRCPKCRCEQVTADKRGVSVAGPLLGGLAVRGPVGLVLGLLGRKRTVITCLKCGTRWSP